MAFSRRLGVVCILGASWIAAVACSDDGDKVKVASEAGAGGEAPSGGKSSAGGSSNNAGKGGTATAGKGGMSTGGNAGTNNLAGNPGSGAGPESQAGAAGAPVVTPNGGAGGEPDVVGGAGGASGAGGAAAVTAQSCTYPCTTNNDCAVLPDDASRQCDPIIHQCRTPQIDDGCTTATDCIPQGNFLAPCASEQDCNVDLEACVTFRGSGFCAPLADPQTGCDPAFGTDHTVANFGAAGTSEVCVDATAQACKAGSCVFSCIFLQGCDDGVCNEANGLCECESGNDCTSGACGADHQCAQCQTSDDCAVSASDTGLDICVDGKCGCSGAASCVNPGFQGAPPVCQ